VVYGEADGEQLLMDVYLPSGDGPFPGVEVIPGGGFAVGHKEDMRELSEFFVGEGFAAFAIDYRPSPQWCFPSQVEDAQTAIRFIREHATDYHVDPGKMATFGGSAGGTLAVAVAATGEGAWDSGSRVAVAASWSGALDMNLAAEERKDAALFQTRLRDYTCTEGEDLASPAAQEQLRAASPIAQLDATDPPMFIANAKDELMPLGQAEAFVQELADLGIEHQFLTPESGHSTAYGFVAREPTVEFLRAHLGPAPQEQDDGRPLSPAFLVVGGGLVAVVGVAVATWWRRRSRWGH
jgi:acetyl esterase/lipase